MKNLFLSLAIAIPLSPFNTAFASRDICNLETFSQEELSDPYVSIKKPLESYSRAESERIAQTIVRKAKEESNSGHLPCLSNTRSCFGHDNAWTYHKELILDSFGNLLRFNGGITSKRFVVWPGKYYDYQTQIGFSCSWGGHLQPQCQKWCSLIVKDGRFHD